MADYNISAEITADASGFESGIKKAQKASKNLSTSVSKVIQGLGKNGLVGALGAVGLASSGLSATLGSVVKIARKVSETMNECTNAYKNQLIAERALNTAIENNPFITGASSKALLQFASEMQKVSNYGDEELIPMMTNLVSLGRTESETMQIMSVAMDMSAVMGISLDSAITQLNATLNGNIGRLGQQNAELKGLTEEELKQGKAVEILGEKFKGLSSATADTSKQLQNIKGDFKEALGQFTLPSSDMWNKFWAGFYERGIEVINKINSYLDAQTIGKKLAGAITDQLKAFGTGDIGGRMDYIRNALKVVTDEELLALQNYLEGLSYISSDQEQILRRIKAETDARKQAVIDQEAQAEASAKQKREEEEKLAKQKELEEQEKKNAEERAKALKLQSEWEDKLFAIRLENLEKTREKELGNEELTQEQKEAINEFYGDQILAMKIKQIEKERDEVLAQEGLTEDAKKSINLYYENKITQANAEENDKRLELKKKTNEEEKKEEQKKFSEMVKMAQDATKKMVETFKNVAKKIVSVFKSVVSGIGNIFSNIISFNPDDALDELLKFEDAVLTFFVETVPKLPQFFATAIQSIAKLIESVINYLDLDMIADIVGSIIKSFLNGVSNIAQLFNKNVDKFTSGLIKIVSTIIQNLASWIESGGWRELLTALLNIQKMFETVIVENIDEIVDTIIAMLPDLIDMLIDSIVSASRTLSRLIKPILKLVVKLIEAIVDVAFSDEVIDASFEVIEAFVEAIIETIIKVLPKVLPKIIGKLIKVVLRSLVSFPIEIAKAFIQGLSKAIVSTNWWQFIKDCFQGLVDAFKNFFGIHSPSTLFESFGTNIVEGLWNGIKNCGSWLWENMSGFFSNIWSGIQGIFSNVGNWFKNTFESAVTNIKNAFDGIGNWFNGVWSGIKNGVQDAFETVQSTVTDAVETVSEVSSRVGEVAEKAVDTVSNWGSSSEGTITGSNAGDVALGVLTGGVSELIKRWGNHAIGTNAVPRGLSIVGEAGPELINFRGGEQILNNRNTNKALAEMGSGKNVTNNIVFNNTKDTTAFAMMSQLRQYNRQLAINGVL